MFNKSQLEKAERLLEICTQKHWRVSTGESCTGGLVAALLTEIPGSSAVVGRCFITYSNRAKREVLGVDAELLKTHGAVSEQVVARMAQNLFDTTSAHLTIAISGVAGPGGGSAEKPVGTVYLATATDAGVAGVRQNFGDIGRSQVRQATVDVALDMLLARTKV